MKKYLIWCVMFIVGFGANALLAHLGFKIGTDRQSAAPFGSVDRLNSVANDQSLPFEKRAEAVLALFAYHTRYGLRGDQIRSVFTRASWLSEASISIVGIVGGMVPIRDQDGCSTVSISLFHKHIKGQPWQVFINLEGEGDEVDVRRFFGETTGSSGFDEMRDFTLCFPHTYDAAARGRIEYYSRWRINISEQQL